MRRIFSATAAVTLLLGLVLAANADTASYEPPAGMMRINVGVRSASLEESAARIIEGYGGQLLSHNAPILVRTYMIPKEKFGAVTSDGDLLEMTRYIVEDQKCFVTFRPNDPSYGSQWGMPCIDAEAAWDVQQGNHNLILAIVDTGCDMDHPDLRNNLDPTIDYDFVNNDNNAEDDYGHGTHVTGIAAAQINNGVGVAGLAQVRVMEVKVMNSGGWGYWSWVSSGITYAADNGAKVMNMSLGGTGFDQGVQDACDYAYYTKDCLVIAAAGNSGSRQTFYPAGYASVMGVAALGSCTSRASYSNYGPNIDICAPGSGIYSTYFGNSYTTMDGTSMASPHVAGVACLYRCQRTDLSASKTWGALTRFADDLGTPGYDEYYGHGRVDAYPYNK